MSKYKGKKALVVGFGRSGVATARYLAKQGAKVTVTDLKQKTELTESMNACADLKLEYELGKHNELTFKSSEMIVVSPGILPNYKPLELAREAGVAITTEIDLAAQGIKEPLICVAGTNGKTTISKLIGEMYRCDEKKAYVGGDDQPLIQYLTQNDTAEAVIAELSTFQLDLTQKIIPAVAVFSNVDPDQMDRYPTLEAYQESIKKLLRACDRNTYVVLNYDHPTVRAFAEKTPGKILWFTRNNPMKISGEFAERFVGCYFDAPNKKIIARITGKEESYDVTKLKIYGPHNKENAMAAICAARVMGISPQAVQKALNEFPNLAHRLEFVRKRDGVFFFNDSKSTNPASLGKAIESFPSSPLILLAGGKDRNYDFSHLAELVKKRCKILILMGEAKEKMNRMIGDFTETYLVGTFEEAVLLAFQKSRNDDVILLSPGCASSDLFRTYEERGDYFKKMVHQL